MQKLFTLTALLVASILVVWIVGCGGGKKEEAAAPPATVTKVTPEDGSTVAANAKITVEFDNPVDACTINGKDATLSSGNKKAEASDLGLAEGAQTVTIEWTNKDGSTDSKTVNYTVKPADKDAPTIDSSTPADGAKDVKPDDVNKNGIVIKFKDATDVDTKATTIIVSLEGTALNWKASWDGMTATLLPLKGADLGFEKTYEVDITVADSVGNSADYTITFTTQAKEQ